MAKQEKLRARSVLLIATLLLITVVGGLTVAGAAGAAPRGPRDKYHTPTDSVSPGRLSTRPPRTHTPPPPNVCCVQPFTGADLTLFVITGLAGIVTGTVLVRRTRARRQASST